MPPSPSSKPSRRKASARGKLQIDLALQGGGSHGAFTWGVLDRLLEDESLEIAGVSGTSAGAMNAVALAAGLMEGGRDGARETLRRFWQRVAETSPFHQLGTSPWASLLGAANPWLKAMTTPWQEAGHQLGQMVGSQLSPYQLNPLNLNPLRAILEETVDFERVRNCDRTHIFIAATQVSTGELRIFRQNELTADMVLASACLPQLFQAVEIDGESYWDGGYAGNPSLLPLISDSPGDDLLLVQINPSHRDTVPTSVNDIMDRINEVTFNTSLLKELRTIRLIKEVIAAAGRPECTYERALFRRIDDLRLHRLEAGDRLSALGASSKTQTGWAFLSQLHDIGRDVADTWLKKHRKDLGKRSTFTPPPALQA